ncbi:MAG: hypothetical protein KY410_01980 [Proteobacteria bacterium]|nr:hypothetical protein [Pseudomonadota bacterium]
MKLRENWRQFTLRIDALSLRERALVMLGAFMVLFLLWDWLLMADIGVRSKAMTNEIGVMQERTQQLNQLIAAAARRGGDPNVALQADIKAIRTRIAALDEMLDARAGNVIPPQAMAGVIEQVLVRQGRLELVSARSLPPSPLFESAALEGDALGAVYKHGLELEVEGRYLDVLGYLRELESLDWQFFWEAVVLEGGDYPSNRVRIRVYSLNFEEGWLGV